MCFVELCVFWLRQQQQQQQQQQLRDHQFPKPLNFFVFFPIHPFKKWKTYLIFIQNEGMDFSRFRVRGAPGIGTLCFALMLVPQVALNTRRRSTEGHPRGTVGKVKGLVRRRRR